MDSELEICAAAFFRNKGKDVITVMELIMTISLDLKWMDPTTASRFVKSISVDKLVSETPEGLLRASPHLREIDVPVAYRPSKNLIERLKASGGEPVPKETRHPPETEAEQSADTAPVLPRLMGSAGAVGMNRGEFVSECNRIVKRFNVDMEVAALMILRDKGADITPYYDDVRESVLRK